MTTEIDQWLFHPDESLDQQVTSVLASPSCAPLYAALCRAYGANFALDLARTCIVQDGGVGLEHSFNYWARYHLGLALPHHAPHPVPAPPVVHEPYAVATARDPVCTFCESTSGAEQELFYTEFYEEEPSPSPVPVPEPTKKPPTWCSVARGKDKPPRPTEPEQPAVILRRPRRFSKDQSGRSSLFAGAGNGPAAVQLGVTNEDFRSLLDAAPRPLVVCEPSNASARALIGNGPALPKGVSVTTTARAAVALTGPAPPTPAPAAFVVHLSPHMVATGLVAVLVAAAVARGAQVAAYCRGTVLPDGVLESLSAWWTTAADGAPKKQPAAKFHTEKTGDSQRRLLGALDAVGQAAGLVVVAGAQDAVALRNAIRRNVFGRLVSRVDAVTMRVHRPLNARAVEAMQSGRGRQCRTHSVTIIPIGHDAVWGHGILPGPTNLPVTVLDLGNAGTAEQAARSALGAVVRVAGTEDLCAPARAPGPTSEADFLHGLSPPGSLLAEVLRVRNDPALLAKSPALPVLVAWGLVRPGKSESESEPQDPTTLHVDTGPATLNWGDEHDDEDLFGSRVVVTPPVPEPALHDWATVAAEWVDDRAALLALIGARFCTKSRFCTDARASEALAAWMTLVGVFDELVADHQGIAVQTGPGAKEEFQRMRAKALGIDAQRTDDLETAVGALARLAELDPDTVALGSTGKAATSWCSTVGLRAQALQQLAEGAAACADGLRLVLRRIFKDRRVADKGRDPLDRFIPEGDEGATEDWRAFTTAAFYSAVSLIGPVFVPHQEGGRGRGRRAQQVRCTCCPTPAIATLESTLVTGRPGHIVPIGVRRVAAGKIVIESAMRRR